MSYTKDDPNKWWASSPPGGSGGMSVNDFQKLLDDYKKNIDSFNKKQAQQSWQEMRHTVVDMQPILQRFAYLEREVLDMKVYIGEVEKRIDEKLDTIAERFDLMIEVLQYDK